MNLRQIIEQSPPGTLFTREGLLETIAKIGDGSAPVMISTAQAAQLLGYSPKWWRTRCASGEIEGAYQDDGERWRLPSAAGRAYIARREAKAKPRYKRKGGLRGPNRKAATAPGAYAARTGSATGETGPLVDGGPAPVRRPALHRTP